MAILNFPNTGLYVGLTYTGDNGVTYVYDGVKWVGEALVTQGTTGFTGSRGNLGYTGSRGVGYTGSQGDIGYVGSEGSPGLQGNRGYTGSKGDPGDRGLQGNTGEQGVSVTLVGSTSTSAGLPLTGNAGDGWIVNNTGHLWFWNTISGVWNDIGAIVGPRGDLGYTGSKGSTGDIGLTGDPGYTGSQGTHGYDGSRGNTGYTGSQGVIGYVGSQGDIGYTGSTGDRGPQGYSGSVGYVGSQGDLGYTGSEGYTGSKGDQGEPGGNANTGNFVFTDDQIAVSDNGDIRVVTNNNTWTFDTNGYTQFPGGGFIGHDSTGTTPAFNGTMIGAGLGDDFNIQTIGGLWKFGADGNLTLPTGGSIYGLSIIGGEGTNVQADQTTEQVYISSYNTSSFTSSVWTFSNTGTLTIPGDIQDDNGSVIRVATTSTAPTRANGQLWYNTVDGRTYVKYDNTWVDTSPAVVPTPETYLDEITIDGSTLNINGSTLTISNTGTLLVNGSEVTSSGGNEYTPTNPNDWSGSPTVGTVTAGLDELASRIVAVEGGGAGGWQLTSSTAVVSLASDGKLTLPNGGIIFDNDGPGGGWLSIAPANAGIGQALVIYPTQQDGNHIHLTANGNNTDLYLGSDDQYVKVDHSGTVVVGTYSTATTNTWTFGTNGVLTLSTASTILGNSSDPNVYIETSTTATTSTWTFGTNGVLTLPAATPVIKGGGTGTDVTVIATTGTNTATWVFGASGSITFPDASVQTTAYTTGQITKPLNGSTENLHAGFTVASITGTNVIYFTPDTGYTDATTHQGTIPIPSYPGQKLTLINDYAGSVDVVWPVGGGSTSVTLSAYENSELTAFNHPSVGLQWWETNRYSW